MMTNPTAAVYRLLENETLWQTSRRVRSLLDDAGIDHAVCGGVAVCLHGYRRNTTDLDLIIRSEDQTNVRRTLLAGGLQWQADTAEFIAAGGCPVQFLIAGQSAGKGSGVPIPLPAGRDNVEDRDELRVVRLSRLIEMKLASGSSNPRRIHRDFADVVELIDIRNLDATFATLLHRSVRDAFRQLVRQVR